MADSRHKKVPVARVTPRLRHPDSLLAEFLTWRVQRRDKLRQLEATGYARTTSGRADADATIVQETEVRDPRSPVSHRSPNGFSRARGRGPSSSDATGDNQSPLAKDASQQQ